MFTSVLDPSQTIQARKKPEAVEPVGGRMGFIDEKEQSLRVPDKTPSMSSHGSIPFKLDVLGEASQIAETAWNSLGGLTQDSGRAVKDLIAEDIFGLGNVSEEAGEVASKAWENHPMTQEEAVVQQANAKALEDAKKIKTLQNWFEQITTAQSTESYEQSMNESLRITGRVVTEEDAQRVGVSISKDNLLRTSTLHRIAEKDEEVQEQTEEKQSEQSLAETQPVVNMNAIMEGGTGGAKANISQTGGGAG